MEIDQDTTKSPIKIRSRITHEIEKIQNVKLREPYKLLSLQITLNGNNKAQTQHLEDKYQQNAPIFV